VRGRSSGPLALGVAVLAILVLVGLVVVASTGSTPGGTADTRAPSETLLDTFFSLALLALIPAAAILIYGLMQRRAIAEEIASGRYRRTSIPALVIFLVLFTGAVYLVRERGGFLNWGDLGETIEIGPQGEIIVRDPADPDAYRAEFAWIPVAIVVGLLAVAVAAFVLASRRRRPGLGEDDVLVAEQLADVLDETLDDLRAEPDARRAVIAAYARLERSFAAAGLPRKRHETAVEYVPRVLAALEVDAGPAETLTGLFTTAKFSQHPVDEEMKLRAIASLEHIRDDLRAAAERAEERARAAEPPSQPEQPATS
jgi:Domain of unknown function (DUF4129)